MKKTPALSEIELRNIEESLLIGVVNRAGLVSFIFAFMFFSYSFSSLEFLRLFKPDLGIWENLLPRFFFNTLPCLGLALYFRNYTTNVRFKVWLWTIGLPVIFAAACMIYVWPLMWAGEKSVYFYVHAANAFFIAATLMVTSPPPKYLAAQIIAFFILMIFPVGILLSRLGEFGMLKWGMMDYVIAFSVSGYSSMMIYRLRRKIAEFDHYMKKTASPFLGSALTAAIYQQKTELLHNRKADAVIVKMDIRGYTEFYKNNDPHLVRQFMGAYHTVVSRNVGQTNGYWHKSIGDGQLASYGVMDAPEELSEIPGLEEELKVANARRTQTHFHNVLAAVTTIAFQFERLKEQFDIENKLSLGIAIASGEVEIRVQGDDTHKMELDIDGEVILRASRLEAYSKIIQAKIGKYGSIVVVSPELQDQSDSRMFERWATTEPDLQIRTYPEITEVAYHIFRDKSERRDRIVKLRAS